MEAQEKSQGSNTTRPAHPPGTWKFISPRTVSNPRDRDLILGYISGTIRLKYTEETARGPSLKFGRQGLLHVGQLNKGGTRVSFRAKGSNTGLNTNPIYMKAWAEAANELKEQGRGAILDGFWPQIDSQEVINKHSPSFIRYTDVDPRQGRKQ
jgi:hypothetical protein